MKYSRYITYLETVLNTGLQNHKIAETEQRKLHESLQQKFSAIETSTLPEKEKKRISEEKKKLKEAIQHIFSICSDSPLVVKDNTNTITGISQALQQSAQPLNIAELPLILSGPMVRRAEPGAVTVWVVLKEATEVTLSVVEDAGNVAGSTILTGNRQTVKLGTNLHIAAVTAKPIAPEKQLQYGNTYFYTLNMGGQDLLAAGVLSTASIPAQITYPDEKLPSFQLPPLDLNKVHLIHSSCRNITSEAYDTLPALDNLMQGAWKTNRPQQLYLSGDQIYADEANEVLEYLYIDIGNTLMSGKEANSSYKSPEKIRSKEEGEPDVCPAEIIPGERGHMHKVKEFIINNQRKSFIDLLKEYTPNTLDPPERTDNLDTPDYIHDLCGFTPTSRFHLFSLSDFFGLYLLNWSDVLWPAFFREEASKKWAVKHSVAYKNEEDDNLWQKLEESISDISKIEKNYIEKLSDKDKKENEKVSPEQKKHYVELVFELKRFRMVIRNLTEMMNLVIFASELGKVRRVLANLATYMMFDDHEVTDDWHMTREWVHRVYSKPMGRRVLQNGLASYAVFQAWGNTPERFETSESAGGKLLNALSAWINSNYTDEANEKIIANALKIPDKTQAAKFRSIGSGDTFPEIFTQPLSWHYLVNHPKYEVLVLDARTFRSFPGSLYGAAEHISAKSLKEQMPEPVTLPPPFSDIPREITFVISPCNVVTIPLFRNYLSGVALPLAHYFTGYSGNRWEMAAYDPDQADSWEVSSKLFEVFLSRLAVRTAKLQPEAKSENRVVILSGDVHFTYAGRLAYWADKPFETEQSKAHEMVVAHLTASGMKNEASAWKKLKLDLLGYEFTDLGSNAQRLPEPEVMVGYAKAPQTLDKAKKDEIVLRTRWFPNYKPGLITQTLILLPNHKIHPEVKLPKPEWMYRIDFIRGTKEKKIENFNTISHFHFARQQAPSSEIIRRSNFASLTIDWAGEGTLVQAIDAKIESFTVLVAQGKTFPQAPFFAMIEGEILYVLETKSQAGNDTELVFSQVKRGKADSTAQAHAQNSTVKIRRTVTQTSWVVAEVSLKEQTQNGSLNLMPSALTRYKVAMAADDPQYTKPTPNTL